MLQVGVHHAHYGSIGILPAVEHGSRQSALPLADEQAYARVFARDGIDDILGAVAAIVIHNDNFVRKSHGIEDGANMAEEATEVFSFAERGNDQGQLFRGRRSLGWRQEGNCGLLVVWLACLSVYHYW